MGWKPWDREHSNWYARNGWHQLLRSLNAPTFSIRNVKVTTTYTGHRSLRSIREISDKAPRDLWFDVDGEQTNVEKYLHSRYQVRLVHPDLPCVDLGKQARQDWVPIELVEVAGGADN